MNIENNVCVISRHIIFAINVNNFLINLHLRGTTINLFPLTKTSHEALEGNPLPCAYGENSKGYMPHCSTYVVFSPLFLSHQG